MLANIYEMFTAFYHHVYLTCVCWFQVSLNTSLGISEPALMNIMKVTLQSHSEWFKIQMCPDPFAKILKIDGLKNTESANLGLNVISESSTISSKHGSSKISSVTDDGDQHKSDSSRSGGFDDGAILTVMVSFQEELSIYLMYFSLYALIYIYLHFNIRNNAYN